MARTMEISDKTEQKTESAYEIKKNMALRFAESLKKNGVVLNYDTFVQRLVTYSQQRGVKYITKLKVGDIEKCMSILNSVEYIR